MSDLFDSDGLGPTRRRVSANRTTSHQKVILLVPVQVTQDTKHSQIPREVNVKPIHNCQVVAKQLQRHNIQNPLKAVDGGGDYNLAPACFLERWVVIAADNDWLTLAGSNLSEGRLDLGIE